MITLSKIHEIKIYKNANIIICIIYFILSYLNLFFFNKINELKKIILDVNFYIIDELFICLIFN